MTPLPSLVEGQGQHGETYATSVVGVWQRQRDDLRRQLPRPLLQGFLHVLQLRCAAAGEALAQRGSVIRERLLSVRRYS